MNKYTEKELWAFVNRANTYDQIEIAIEWLYKHGQMRNGSYELWDDLMMALHTKRNLMIRAERQKHMKPYVM